MAARGSKPPSADFAAALGDVKPIADRGKHVATPSRPASGPPSEREPEGFVHPEPGEARLAHRPRVRANTFERLRSGALVYQRRIDLHQLRAAAAEDHIARAIESATRVGQTVLLVVHGRGRHTGGVTVLREALVEWLEANDRVLAYAPAPGPDGGAGATLVLIRGR